MLDNQNLETRFLTKQQVAEFLGISVRTLSRLHAERKGPPRIKVGGKILYSFASIINWLRRQEDGPLRNGA